MPDPRRIGKTNQLTSEGPHWPPSAAKRAATAIACKMYSVDDTTDDLESGSILLWNGRERTVTSVSDDTVCIEGNPYSVTAVNEMFESEDTPFEIRQ